MQPMADRLGMDHQGLQQFVTTSTWDTEAVRMRLPALTVEVVEPVTWASAAWRLSVPASWGDQAVDEADRTGVAASRSRCGFPEDERHRLKWAQVAQMLDELAERGPRPPLLAANAGYGVNSQLRRALDQRGTGYITQAKGGNAGLTLPRIRVG